jgi:diguanylate cyclase (GGDEF)-like protein
MNLIEFVGGVIFGAAVGAGIGIWLVTRRRGAAAGVPDPDFSHVLDLLRRVHVAQICCLVMEDETTAISSSDSVDRRMTDRALAAARLAIGDPRQHVIHGDPEIVAVGDGQVAASMALSHGVSSEDLGQITADLRRLIAGARVRLLSAGSPHADPRKAFDLALARLDSLESLSAGLCEAARTMTNHATAVVLRDPITQLATVAAVSRGSDRKLVGVRVTAESSAGRASMGQLPLVGTSTLELLGTLPDPRRRQGEAGVAYPLHDGRQGIGALIVFGRPEHVPPEMREKVAQLATQISPHVAAAAAVRAAETRAVTDQLTGLPNRRALERALALANGPTAVLMVDLDHFKSLNDAYGHAAGDAALKRMAAIFMQTLREGDVAARVGGEEFALLLPGIDRTIAVDVAERVRRATADAAFTWAGAEVRLSCSVGVASYPEPIRDMKNLLVSADAALYRAKQTGRNRVESAT